MHGVTFSRSGTAFALAADSKHSAKYTVMWPSMLLIEQGVWQHVTFNAKLHVGLKSDWAKPLIVQECKMKPNSCILHHALTLILSDSSYKASCTIETSVATWDSAARTLFKDSFALVLENWTSVQWTACCPDWCPLRSSVFVLLSTSLQASEDWRAAKQKKKKQPSPQGHARNISTSKILFSTSRCPLLSSIIHR